VAEQQQRRPVLRAREGGDQVRALGAGAEDLGIEARRRQVALEVFDGRTLIARRVDRVEADELRQQFGGLGLNRLGDRISLPSGAMNDLALALELADVADRITMGRYRAADLAVETKPDATPVTEADRAVEQALRSQLADVRPDDLVVGEEFGGDLQARDGRRWIIDPIDGTKSYLRGMFTWATLIGLQVDGEPVVGVVSAPAGGRRWWASRGEGAFCDGRRIGVSRVGDLADAQLCWSGIEDWDTAGRLDALLGLARRCWRSRGLGDAWQYMMVAEGAAEIAVDPSVSLWDLAAVQAIVEEAGGRFTDLSGVRGAGGGSGLATNGRLHETVLTALGR
jgi:histidinol-phosphatase